MDLHELHTGAEWYKIPDKKRTALQRLAARTQGIVTPGNAVTISGAIITSTGLWAFWQHKFVAGFILIGIGRLCDILDGHLARATHTSSPFGEGLDAATDKLIILLAAITLLATHAVPLAIIIAVAILEFVTAVTVMAGRKMGVRLHPLLIGKYATFGLWVSLVLYLIAHALGSTYGNGRLLYIIATLGSIMALCGATAAFGRYIQTISRGRSGAPKSRKKFF